jgi:hypothetical protein
LAEFIAGDTDGFGNDAEDVLGFGAVFNAA